MNNCPNCNFKLITDRKNYETRIVNGKEILFKKCTVCNEYKETKFFRKRKLKTMIGYRSDCNFCQSERLAKKYESRKGK